MLSNTLGLNQDINISLTASFLGWSNASTAVSALGRPYTHRFFTLQEKTSGTLTIVDRDILRLEQILAQVQKHLEILIATSAEVEIPEVFELRPLSSTRVTVKIRKIKPAQFYFVADDDLSIEDIEG